jgi:hypothetical protein
MVMVDFRSPEDIGPGGNGRHAIREGKLVVRAGGIAFPARPGLGPGHSEPRIMPREVDPCQPGPGTAPLRT